MDQKVWSVLLALESRDITQQLFKNIHERNLGARRAREINAAAKQAREYFRNASNADVTVRPLLIFYGVSSLSRALVLMLKAKGGEESLKPAHGLEVVGDWRMVMANKNLNGQAKLRELTIRRRSGLFSHLLERTCNIFLLRRPLLGDAINIRYEIPDDKVKVSLEDLFSRIPELWQVYSNVSDVSECAVVEEIWCSADSGFRAKLDRGDVSRLKRVYSDRGYTVRHDENGCVVNCDADTFRREMPLIVQNNLDNFLGETAILCLASPFPGGARYSQLCITYMVAFILGMLVRYYPTYWMALIHGSKGDSVWPPMNYAQEFVVHAYPGLVAQFVREASSTGYSRLQTDVNKSLGGPRVLL